VTQALPLQNHFLWMNLAEPDTTFLIAILVGASTWVQQKMTTPRNIGDERQQSMNSMMLWMMPLMFAWFTLTVPSGLAVYWTATNLIGITLQYFYMRPAGQTWRDVFMPASSAAPARGPSPAPQSRDDQGEEEAIEATEPAALQSRSKRRRSRGRRRGKR
jgi:membrane protein insertase Oxa1/YidC/SpoIIIJ